MLEDPNTEPPEEAFAWTRSWKDAPAEPGLIRIGFEAGYPVSVNGETMSPAKLITRVGEFAGLHGVGRIDLMENRVVGIKSRETYECPAAVALIAAHQDLERFTTLGLSARTKAQLDTTFAQLDLRRLLVLAAPPGDPGLQRRAQPLRDRRGDAEAVQGLAAGGGPGLAFGVYNKLLSTYGREDRFDHRAAEGFIDLLGLQLQEYSRLHGGGA